MGEDIRTIFIKAMEKAGLKAYPVAPIDMSSSKKNGAKKNPAKRSKRIKTRQ